MTRTDQVRAIAARRLAELFPGRSYPCIRVTVEVDDDDAEVFRVAACYRPVEPGMSLAEMRAAASDLARTLNTAGLGGPPLLTLQPLAPAETIARADRDIEADR